MSLSQSQQRNAKKFLQLINPNNADLAEEQFETLLDELTAFDEEDDDAEDDDDDYGFGGDEPESFAWQVKDIIDWQSGFYVDWKDTESLVGSLNALCENQQIELDWGVPDPLEDNFLDQYDLPELLKLASDKLETLGYSLWNWQTDGDAYGGWLSRSSDDQRLQQLAGDLGIEMRLASEPY